MQICMVLPILKYCFSCLGWSRSVTFFFLIPCNSSSHNSRAKCWPNRIVCNFTSRHFDTRCWHAELPETQHVIILKQMLRCRVACNLICPYFRTICWDIELTATQQVVMLKPNVEIPSCMQLSKSSFPYKMLKFKVGKTYFCHQIFRYWVLGTR